MTRAAISRGAHRRLLEKHGGKIATLRALKELSFFSFNRRRLVRARALDGRVRVPLEFGLVGFENGTYVIYVTDPLRPGMFARAESYRNAEDVVEAGWRLVGSEKAEARRGTRR